MDKIAVYCGTRNLYPVMTVAAKSLLYNTPVDRVFFFIEDDGFPDDIPDIITTVNVSAQTFFPPSGANYSSSWTYMAYIRLALTKILPEIHQALYLDTDTLVLKDISPLLSADLVDCFFGMVAEDIGDVPLEICKSFVHFNRTIIPFQSDSPRPSYPVRPYFNSGVMLMNLDLLRSSGMDDALIHELNTVSYPYPDQDAINILCNGRIAPFPTEYNVIASLIPDFPQDAVRIKHFASDKPLWKSSLWQSFKRLPWDAVMTRHNTLKGVCTL